MDTDTMPPPSPPPAPDPARPAAPGPSPWSQPLFRSRDERLIAGVAGGIAERHGWDPVLVRIAMVAAALVTSGLAVVAYVVAWFVVPETPRIGEPSATRRRHARRPGWQLWVGIVLVWWGAGALLDELDIGWGLGRLFWPIALVTAGVALLVLRHPSSDETAEPSRVEPQGIDTTGAGATAVRSAYGAQQPWPSPEAPHPPNIPPLPPYATVPPPGPRRPRRERSRLGRITWAVVFLVAGGWWLLDATGAVDVDPFVALASLVIVVGLGLVVGTWFGRSHGLIPLGVLLVVITGVGTHLDVSLDGGVGERSYRPLTTAEIPDRYELAMGSLTLDLRALDVDADATVVIDADVGLGELLIELPADATVELVGAVGVGEMDLLTEPSDDGVDLEADVSVDGRGPTFVIDAHVGVGALDVDRVGDLEVIR